MAHRGVVEINGEGFEEIIEIDPSSWLVSTRLIWHVVHGTAAHCIISYSLH